MSKSEVFLDWSEMEEFYMRIEIYIGITIPASYMDKLFEYIDNEASFTSCSVVSIFQVKG